MVRARPREGVLTMLLCMKTNGRTEDLPSSNTEVHLDQLGSTTTGPSRGLAPKSSTEPRLFARPVLRILSRETGDTVGYLYEWNTGDRQPMWTDGRVGSIEYAPMTSTSETSDF